MHMLKQYYQILILLYSSFTSFIKTCCCCFKISNFISTRKSPRFFCIDRDCSDVGKDITEEKKGRGQEGMKIFSAIWILPSIHLLMGMKYSQAEN